MNDGKLWPIALVTGLLIIVVAFLVWFQTGVNTREAGRCKKYGTDWHLWHSKTDPSFKGCKNNEGTLKDIPT